MTINESTTDRTTRLPALRRSDTAGNTGDDTGGDSSGVEPALLFLPGWCGDRGVFDDLLDAADRRALSVDWPGHGETPPADGDFTTTDLVDATIRTLEESGVRQVVPVALSHAGWVAIELRRRLGPERVPGLVLLDWMVLGPPPPFTAALAGLQDPAGWEGVRDGLFGMWTTSVDLPPLHAYVAGMGRQGFAMWSRAAREIAASFETQGSPVAALGRLDPPPPTLHLYAQPEDPAFLEAQQGYAAGHPWFGVRRLSARSHFPMFEVPGDMAAAVEEFVAGLR
jgi:pimeloyl-ACP methyl ester carboxylesterase